MTDAQLRTVEHGGLRFALITLDNGLGNARPATLGPEGLRRLGAALDAVADMTVGAIAVTGVGGAFCAGADLDVVRGVTNRDQAAEFIALGQQVFRRLAVAGAPTFAFVNGTALGGGLELALHCRYRALVETAAALGTPECQLGLVPAWGGTYLLPHLIGAKPAVDVVVRNPLTNNKVLRADKALSLGLVDVLLPADDFLTQSLDWAAQVVRGTVEVRRADVDASAGMSDAVARTRSWVDGKLRGAAPAAYRALDLLDQAPTQSVDDAYSAAVDAGADLSMTEQLHAALYAFDLVHTRARAAPAVTSEAQARPVKSVAVVGAGVMASQLVTLLVQRLGVPVTLVHRNEAGLERVLAYVAKYAEGTSSLVRGSLDYPDLADVDVVIEAVAEQPAVKSSVLASIDAVVRPDCVIATNTSSLSITGLAAGLTRPERVVGLHFFNPVDLLPLLEVVHTEHTDVTTLATAYDVARRLGKTAIGVADRPGFVFNRLVMRFFGEVLRIAEDGTPLPVADRALDSLGLPMPPTQLMTFTGLPLVCHITEALHEAFPDRFPVPESLRRLVDAGKTGFYVHAGGEKAVDPEVYALAARPDTLVEISADEVRERALSALTQEIGLLLDEGVVADVRDIDLALIIGGNFPFHLGGITPYLDREGFSERVTGRRFLSRGVASAASG